MYRVAYFSQNIRCCCRDQAAPPSRYPQINRSENHACLQVPIVPIHAATAFSEWVILARRPFYPVLVGRSRGKICPGVMDAGRMGIPSNSCALGPGQLQRGQQSSVELFVILQFQMVVQLPLCHCPFAPFMVKYSAIHHQRHRGRTGAARSSPFLCTTENWAANFEP